MDACIPESELLIASRKPESELLVLSITISIASSSTSAVNAVIAPFTSVVTEPKRIVKVPSPTVSVMEVKDVELRDCDLAIAFTSNV